MSDLPKESRVDRPGYRVDRLRRAWQLVKSGRVRHLGGSQYLVAGNVEEVYEVDLEGDPPCYCRDMEYRGAQIKEFCKHVGAARLSGLDPSLLGTIADWIEAEQKRDG